MGQAKDNSWDDSAFTETIAEEAPTAVSFTVTGETFKGTYTGLTEVTDPNTGKTWIQYLFRAAPNQDGIDEGELCALGGYAIDKAMKDVKPGARVRLEYVKDVETGKGAPLKSVRVSIAK